MNYQNISFYKIFYIVFILPLLGCPNREYYNAALQPVYADSTTMYQIRVEPPRAMVETGKIYYKDSVIYIIEQYRGIHIIDNRNPVEPKNVRFLKIEGCQDIAIKQNTLYADNYKDLVAIDIFNPNNPVVTQRIKGVYSAYKGDIFPKDFKGYFECVDSSKGKIIAWRYVLGNDKLDCRSIK